MAPNQWRVVLHAEPGDHRMPDTGSEPTLEEEMGGGLLDLFA